MSKRAFADLSQEYQDMADQQAQGRARGRGRMQPSGGSSRPPGFDGPNRPASDAPSDVGNIRPSIPLMYGAGRASLHRSEPQPGSSRGEPQSGPPDGGAGGGHGEQGGRGAMRGRRMIYDIIKTKSEDLPTKKGQTGNQVKLTANFFKVLKKPAWSLYQYHVTFSPEIDINSIRKRLMREHKQVTGGNIFDGSSLFLTHRMQKDITELVSKNEAGEPIQIIIKFVGQVSMMEGRSLQILNIIMRKALEGLKLQLVGRNFFDSKAKVTIREHNLELWPGYITSIRQHEQDILLCAEISHKVMRTDTIYDILQSCTHQSQHYQDSFKRAVIGMIVLTDYNNKFYRIDDVDFTTKPNSTFKTKTGQTSFVDYYRTKYNIHLRDPNQPMLISRAKARDIRAGQAEIIALVPELCRATGISEEMRSNFQLMKAMANYTKVNADVRMKKLYTLYQRLAKTPESMTVFKEWELKLDSNLIEICGRELKNENIVFGNGIKVPTDENADWTREFRNNRLFTTVPLSRWYVIVPDRNMRETTDFLSCLADAARGMGFKIEPPNKFTIRDDRSQTYVTAIERCANDDPQLIFCVVPNNRSDRYSAIKKKCCVDRAIPTQVMLARTVTPKRGANVRSLMSVATKVAIQLNCKLGCAPWLVEIPLSGLMTIGFDVCHDSTNKAKSYGALVATMDLRTSSNYFSAVSAHKNGEELSNELALNVSKALRQYQNLHGKLPSRIIFYRDGVGEGQLQFVIDHEIENLKSKLNLIYNSAKQDYQFAFIVVNKRVNARFFKGNHNPKPGTVIDDVVTSPESYDFYLVSQLSRQGTVSPTYYNIVTENIGLNADRLQILTYKQCHLYYNWSGTTRVPAVCQYAHKLAFLVGQFIHQSPSNILEKNLYFL